MDHRLGGDIRGLLGGAFATPRAVRRWCERVARQAGVGVVGGRSGPNAKRSCEEAARFAARTTRALFPPASATFGNRDRAPADNFGETLACGRENRLGAIPRGRNLPPRSPADVSFRA